MSGERLRCGKFCSKLAVVVEVSSEGVNHARMLRPSKEGRRSAGRRSFEASARGPACSTKVNFAK